MLVKVVRGLVPGVAQRDFVFSGSERDGNDEFVVAGEGRIFRFLAVRKQKVWRGATQRAAPSLCCARSCVGKTGGIRARCPMI